MRIKMSNNQNKTQALNVTVRVKGFVQDGNEVGVQGVNVLTGEEATFWLTVSGKRAENENRESLKQLRDGIKRGRDDVRKLEIEGLVSFKSAFPKKGDGNHYWSTWPNVLAYNAEDAKKYVDYGKAAILTMHDTKDFFDESIPDSEKQKPWGKLTIYNDKPEHHVVGSNPDDLFDKVAAYANHIKAPAFLIRYLDANNGVLGFSSFWNNYSKEEGRNLTAPEVAAALVESVTKNLESYSACRAINVVPGRRYSVSMRQLRSKDAKENKLKMWCNFASYFFKKTVYQDETYFDFYCRELFAKIGGDDNAFVNGIQFVNSNPEAYGVDPVLIGGLQYSAEVQAEMSEGQEEGIPTPSHSEENQHTPATEPQQPAPQTAPAENAGSVESKPKEVQEPVPQNNMGSKPEPPPSTPKKEEQSGEAEKPKKDPFASFSGGTQTPAVPEDLFKGMTGQQKGEGEGELLPPQDDSFPFGDMDTGFDGDRF